MVSFRYPNTLLTHFIRCWIGMDAHCFNILTARNMSGLDLGARNFKQPIIFWYFLESIKSSDELCCTSSKTFEITRVVIVRYRCRPNILRNFEYMLIGKWKHASCPGQMNSQIPFQRFYFHLKVVEKKMKFSVKRTYVTGDKSQVVNVYHKYAQINVRQETFCRTPSNPF